jgi:hypothetical protein
MPIFVKLSSGISQLGMPRPMFFSKTSDSGSSSVIEVQVHPFRRSTRDREPQLAEEDETL